MELFLDTATDLTTVGLSRQGELVAEVTWRSQRGQSAELLPALDGLLQRVGVPPQDVRAVFVALGPGGFSSLRVGITVAKGLAFSLGLPLVGVSSFAVAALPFHGLGLPVRALLDAGRGEVASTLFPTGEVPTAGEIAFDVVAPTEVFRSTTVKTLFCGESTARLASAIEEALGPLAVVPHRAARLSSGPSLAWLGWQRLQGGLTDDPATLQPVYARQPSITLKGSH